MGGQSNFRFNCSSRGSISFKFNTKSGPEEFVVSSCGHSSPIARVFYKRNDPTAWLLFRNAFKPRALPRFPISSATTLRGLPRLTFAAEVSPSINPLNYPGPAWSPYVAGAGIGVLSWLTFYFSNKAIGASSFYATLAGFIGKAIAPRQTESLKYYKENPPKVDWELVFIACVIVGSYLAALTGGEITNQWVPSMWAARFGDSIVFRAVVGFLGGLLMAFGARLADGCTSGHGISGTLQLNVGSWIAIICMFIGGIATAMLLYRA